MLENHATREISSRHFLKARNRIAKNYSHNSDVIDEIAKRLLGCLDIIKVSPNRILDLGCALGQTTHQLKQRYPSSQIIALEPAQQLCRRVPKGLIKQTARICAWYNQLPFLENSIDVIFSNMSLQWQSDWPQLAQELFRVLRPNGLLLFSIAGPDTLKELRSAWSVVDDSVHVMSFTDMHDIGDVLLQQKFADPVMDMELLTLNYPSLGDLLAELHALGCQNTLARRFQGCTGKQSFQEMEAAYPKVKNIQATVEVIYGHAWKPEPRTTQPVNATGEVSIPLGNITRR